MRKSEQMATCDQQETHLKVTRTNKFTNLVEETWELALRKEGEIPANWMNNREVLVGRTAR